MMKRAVEEATVAPVRPHPQTFVCLTTSGTIPSHSIRLQRRKRRMGRRRGAGERSRLIRRVEPLRRRRRNRRSEQMKSTCLPEYQYRHVMFVCSRCVVLLCNHRYRYPSPDRALKPKSCSSCQEVRSLWWPWPSYLPSRSVTPPPSTCLTRLTRHSTPIIDTRLLVGVRSDPIGC